MAQTAMQELIEFIEMKREAGEGDLRTILWKAEKLLEIEKRQIETSFHHGYNNGNIDTGVTAEKYYIENFKK